MQYVQHIKPHPETLAGSPSLVVTRSRLHFSAQALSGHPENRHKSAVSDLQAWSAWARAWPGRPPSAASWPPGSPVCAPPAGGTETWDRRQSPKHTPATDATASRQAERQRRRRTRTTFTNNSSTTFVRKIGTRRRRYLDFVVVVVDCVVCIAGVCCGCCCVAFVTAFGAYGLVHFV